MFDENGLESLEYNKILTLLSAFAQSKGGKRSALSLAPKTTIEAAEHELSLTAEADRVLFEFSVSPSFSVDEIEDILSKADKGAVLSIREILRVGRALSVARKLLISLKKVSNIPLLSDMAKGLFIDEPFEKKLFSAFISDSDIADTASENLATIRSNLRKLADKVRASLQSFIGSPTYRKYLQDAIITVRGDRYVIPVKSEFKGMIPGLVHDQSASGATIYIEPMQVVNLNNQIKTEKLAEDAEIDSILRSYSFSIAGMSESISSSYNIMVAMDVIFARAQLAHSQKAIRPDLNETGELSIVEGRHPLIAPKIVVPLTLKMRSEDKMLLITGPNTGGKTVTLKMAGLFVLQALSGIYIPAKSANIPIVDGVYSDIGDEQSIEQNLSTFSGHITNISDILDKMTDKSLLLFDELGSGTDPSEGAAIAVAICDYVIKSGAKFIVTSHFNDLKEFALTHGNVVTASMEFDTATFKPTFKLVMGAIGTSNALDIATNLGLKPEIIARAKESISTDKQAFDSVLSAAEETRRRAEELVLDASLDREKAADALREAESKKQEFAVKLEKLNDSIRRKTKDLIEDSVAEADEIIDQLREILNRDTIEEADIFKARALKRKLQTMSARYGKDEIAQNEPDNTPLEIGDPVWVKSLGKRGFLVSTNSRGEASIQLGKLNVKIKKGDYYKVKA